MADVFSRERFFGDGPDIRVVPAEHHGRVAAHSHEFCEIVYVADGFTLHSTSGVMSILVTGDFFFIRPGEEHSYINAYQTKLYNLIFHPSALGETVRELEVLPGLAELFSGGDGGSVSKTQPGMRILHVPIGERHEIETAFEKMNREQDEKRVGWECSLSARLVSLLIRYSRMYEEQWETHTAPPDEYFGYIYKILRYVDTHYAEPITMNDLSAVTGLSVDYMSRKFKSALNMTPSEYVRKFRIARAMELLCTTELSVAEIASRTGFSDISLFSRVFKQSVGLPPASYRKNTVV